MHLVAQSVGACLAGYGLNSLSDTTPGMSPVKSFVMLQGILPAYAFASSLPSHPDRPGALAHAIRNVDGPVIVTYSSHDQVASVTYELTARLSGDDDAPGLHPTELRPFSRSLASPLPLPRLRGHALLVGNGREGSRNSGQPAP